MQTKPIKRRPTRNEKTIASHTSREIVNPGQALAIGLLAEFREAKNRGASALVVEFTAGGQVAAFVAR